MKPFGSNITSVLAQPDFRNVASKAFDAGQTIPQMLISACERYGDRPAFTNLDHTLSFNDVNRLSADFAAYLRNGLGLQTGSRVAIMLPNLLQYPVALLGVLRADLIAVLVNPMYTAREPKTQFKSSRSTVFVGPGNFGCGGGGLFGV